MSFYRKALACVCSVWLLASCAGDGPKLADLADAAGAALRDGDKGALTSSDITRGLKEALSTGSNAVVNQLGTANGFNGDPTIRIALPSSLLFR